MSASLRANPRLSQWLRFADGKVALSPGKVEIGQGILTALAQIAADELDVDLATIAMVPARTGLSPNEGVTSGSLSVQDCGQALRIVCADTRALFLAAAAERLGVEAAALTVSEGVIAGPNNVRTSYWELAPVVDLDCEARLDARAKPVAARVHAGTAAQRIDLPDKLFGVPRYIHDLALPGMLHGCVVRPRAPGARLESLDEASAAAVPGFLRLVRDGSFLGVLAETEQAAREAARRVAARARWSAGFELPDEAALDDWHRQGPHETSDVFVSEAKGAAPVARTLSRDYSRPFIAHGSIAPSCALAQWSGESLRVWTHSQGVYNLRADLAIVLGTPAETIVVQHVEGAGCYGHNGADDVALDAALIARAAEGQPVHVQWSREDELARAPFGAAMSIRLEADLGADGAVVGWRHDIFGNGHVSRPGRTKTPGLLAASEIAHGFPRLVATNPPLASGGGAERNAVPPYDFPGVRVRCHRLTEMPLRTSALRSLGAHGNVFAAESFIDEIAAELQADPLAFRLAHLTDPRARAVVERAARIAGWGTPLARDGAGRGLAYARYKGTGAYCAVVAEVEGEADIAVRRLVVAVDVGEAINPDGVVNQIEGGAIQATSWTIREAVRFDRREILSDSWESYPILRFSQVPRVEVSLIARPEAPPLGAGEAAHGPTAAAIGNAVYAALGVRVRRMPIDRDSIIAAMEAAA